MEIDIDTAIETFIESLSFENMIRLGNHLGADCDFAGLPGDLWPDRQAEVEVNVCDAFREIFD